MDLAGELPTLIMQHDIAADRICKELKTYDFDTLDRRSVDFDREHDFASAQARFENSDALRRLLGSRTAMEDEAGIRVDRVALEPIAATVRPLFVRERGDVENPGRKNERTFDPRNRPSNFDLDVIGSPDFRLSASQEKEEAAGRNGRDYKAVPRPRIMLLHEGHPS